MFAIPVDCDEKPYFLITDTSDVQKAKSMYFNKNAVVIGAAIAK
jgi:hypothetical protein